MFVGKSSKQSKLGAWSSDGQDFTSLQIFIFAHFQFARRLAACYLFSILPSPLKRTNLHEIAAAHLFHEFLAQLLTQHCRLPEMCLHSLRLPSWPLYQRLGPCVRSLVARSGGQLPPGNRC